MKAAFGKYTLVATCPAGQKFDKEVMGYCYEDIKGYIESNPDVYWRKVTLKPNAKSQFALEKELDEKYGCCLKSCSLGCKACGSVAQIQERLAVHPRLQHRLDAAIGTRVQR